MELKALSRGKLVLCLQGQPEYSPERKWTYIQVVSGVKCITAVILWTCRDGNGGLEREKKKKKGVWEGKEGKPQPWEVKLFQKQ